MATLTLHIILKRNTFFSCSLLDFGFNFQKIENIIVKSIIFLLVLNEQKPSSLYATVKTKTVLVSL